MYISDDTCTYIYIYERYMYTSTCNSIGKDICNDEKKDRGNDVCKGILIQT